MLAIWILNVVLPVVVTTHANNSRNSVPNHEWKEVLPGQVVPPSTNMIENLNPEYTEAKLKDMTPNVSDRISGDPAKSATIMSKYAVVNSLEKPKTQSTKRFRSYEELKKDFQKMKVDTKTDPELINEIMVEIKQGNPTTERLLILLEDLSYYLHQIDNARIFSKSGFETLLQLLNHPSYHVQRLALRVIGAATQGNSEVKVIAIQKGVLDQLHSFLIASINEQDSSELTTLLGGVSTLGSLLRDFPYAQKLFFSTSGISPSGFELFAQLSRINVPNSVRNLRVRILTLLTDLYSERLDAQKGFEKDPIGKMDVWNMYASIPFEESFLIHGFCETLRISLVHDVQKGKGENDLSAPTNHDIRENILTACLKFFNLCGWESLDSSNKHRIRTLLDSIIDEYKLRSKSETDDIDTYFTDMLTKAQKFKNMLEPYEFPKTDL